MGSGTAALVFLLCWPLAAAAEVPGAAALVRVRPDREPPDIYIDLRATPPERFAARELRTYLGKITGREFRIRFDYWLRGEPTKPYIAVGRSTLTESLDTAGLGTEQYIVDVTPDRVVIVGGPDRRRGVLYGVYELLEGLGVRWYRPEPWGEHVPTMDEIRLPIETRVSRPPAYEYRSVLGGGFTRNAEMTLDEAEWGSLWSVRNRLNGSDPGSDPRYGGQFTPRFDHIYYQLIPVEQYFDEHPEFFCLYKGERRRVNPDGPTRPGNPTGLQLCLSNPDLQELFAQKIIAQAKRCPDLRTTTFSVTPNDACPFCECDECRKMDDPAHPELMSNRVCAFTNIIARKVAEAVPGARVSLGIYSTWTAPPTIVKRLEPNIVIHICLINEWADYTKRLMDPEPNWNIKARESLARWQELGASAIMTYEYWSGYAWPGPLPLVRTMADRLGHYRDLNVTGVYNETSPHWGPQGLELYMCARLLWDPELDIRKELDLYYRNYYGPAAEPMREYHEALMDALANHPYPVYSGGRGMHLVLTPALLERLGRCLDRAEAAAQGQPLYQRRLAGVRAGHEFARRVCEILSLKVRDGVKRNVDGVFAGRGFYLESASAKEAFDRLAEWVQPRCDGDATFDVSPDPPRLTYVREDVLQNSALQYLDEEQLLQAFE
jgi:hypothetical protein